MACNELKEDAPIVLPGFSPRGSEGIGEVWLLPTLHGKDLTRANEKLLHEVILPSFKQTMARVSRMRSRDKRVHEVGLFQFDGERRCFYCC